MPEPQPPFAKTTLSDAEFRDAAIAASSAPESTTSHTAGSPARVLIVEDSLAVAESLQLALESYGFVCRLAFSGADGLRQAEAFRAGIVLIDLGLPDLDGVAVARALRGLDIIPPPLLVAVSGRPEDERCAEGVFDHYFTKPVRLTALLTFLRAAAPE